MNSTSIQLGIEYLSWINARLREQAEVHRQEHEQYVRRVNRLKALALAGLSATMLCVLAFRPF